MQYTPIILGSCAEVITASEVGFRPHTWPHTFEAQGGGLWEEVEFQRSPGGSITHVLYRHQNTGELLRVLNDA